MTRKMFLQGLAVAVALIGPALAAPKTNAASCCAAKARCCDRVPVCCDQREKAACCKKGGACCDARPCCAPAKATAGKMTCSVTGLPRAACCASKASAMPPCCQQGCETPVKR